MKNFYRSLLVLGLLLLALPMAAAAQDAATPAEEIPAALEAESGEVGPQVDPTGALGEDIEAGGSCEADGQAANDRVFMAGPCPELCLCGSCCQCSGSSEGQCCTDGACLNGRGGGPVCFGIGSCTCLF